MYSYNSHFCLFFRTYLSVLAPSSETSEGVGTIRTLGSLCSTFGRDPCSVSRVTSLVSFLAVGMDKANPRVSTTSPGLGGSASPIPERCLTLRS